MIRITFLLSIFLIGLTNHLHAGNSADPGPDTFGYTSEFINVPAEFNLGDATSVNIAVADGNPDIEFTDATDGYFKLTMPFEFTLYDTTIPAGGTLYVSGNGYISLEEDEFIDAGTGKPFNPTVVEIPNTAKPGNTFYGFWHQMTFNDDSTFIYGTTTLGDSNREAFVLRWTKMAPIGKADDDFTFEIVMEKGTNNLYSIIRQFSPLTARNVIGLEDDADSGEGLQAGCAEMGTVFGAFALAINFPNTPGPALKEDSERINPPEEEVPSEKRNIKRGDSIGGCLIKLIKHR